MIFGKRIPRRATLMTIIVSVVDAALLASPFGVGFFNDGVVALDKTANINIHERSLMRMPNSMLTI